MTRKILVVQDITETHEKQIRSIAREWELVHGKDEEKWQPHVADAEIIVGWHSSLAKECLQPDTALRWIQNWGAGVDNMPLQGIAEHGVILTTTSGVHPNPISESIFAMMLGLTRKVHIAIRNQLQHKWVRYNDLGEVHGKTIAIIGAGSIGLEVAKLSKVFGMTVLGVKRTLSESVYVDRMVTMDGLNEVLSESDYVVVTLPHTAETHHIIGREQFAAMKPNAYYINIGRGGTTDTAALIEALQSGSIAGAGLDVFEVEPLPADNLLWDMENVIITPHNSGVTEYYQERAMQIFLRNLRDYTEGREPQLNRVDFKNQY
ncbi:D-2-hydroxyacid dehydrogenase [Paenibacillus agricola]|uniref:D-2-hydroxyacid dehydrogenase n=1 Tax=Paenibacillus agricola TaxID=2716264 RepID=A0ABX0JCP9_9BACL|nr:D-2-hydroxyacid dehydrogenase [Paenibacillus agricola]NHN33019.1 D-2-hydroxyacid dehydrogenase [Paenibacillus agricola]